MGQSEYLDALVRVDGEEADRLRGRGGRDQGHRVDGATALRGLLAEHVRGAIWDDKA